MKQGKSIFRRFRFLLQNIEQLALCNKDFKMHPQWAVDAGVDRACYQPCDEATGGLQIISWMTVLVHRR